VRGSTPKDKALATFKGCLKRGGDIKGGGVGLPRRGPILSVQIRRGQAGGHVVKLTHRGGKPTEKRRGGKNQRKGTQDPRQLGGIEEKDSKDEYSYPALRNVGNHSRKPTREKWFKHRIRGGSGNGNVFRRGGGPGEYWGVSVYCRECS